MNTDTRRSMYRKGKRLLVQLLASRWEGPRHALERAVRLFLKGRRRAYLLRLFRERAFACAVAGAILVSGGADAGQRILLSDVAAGDGGFMISGYGQVGYSVSGGTDINGDGLDDVVIGAPNAIYSDSTVGKVFVVFGKSDTTNVTTDAIEVGTGGWVIYGATNSRRIGTSVSSAGVINNGILPEVIVGTNQIFGGTDARTYVVFGKGTTTPVLVADVDAGTGGFAITGTESEQYGRAAAYSSGDINGDGRDDIAVGAPAGSVSISSYEGRAYLVFGKNSLTPVTGANVLAGTGGFVVNGADPGEQAGRAVSMVNDLNGDGRDELLVSAPNATAGSAYDGAIYVVFGKTTGTAIDLSTIEAGTGGFVITGANNGDNAGESIAGCGDVNGDGFNDIVIGAPSAYYADSNARGQAYVVFGKADTNPVALSDVRDEGIGGFVINGLGNGAYAGQVVAAGGDINGDGLADVLISAYVSPDAPGDPGSVYVVYGRTSTTPVFLTDIENDGIGGFVIQGIDAGDRAGFGVSGAGDVNGDGADDIVVGAPLASEAYVVFGRKPAPVTVGLTQSGTGEPISSGVVFMERTDAPVGFRAPLAGVFGGSAIYESQFADAGSFSVVAIGSGFQPSDPVLVNNDGSVPGIELINDASLATPNILTVEIRVVNQQGQATGQRILTKTAQLRVANVDTGMIALYGQGNMVFVGAPRGEVEVFIPDTTQYDFVPKIVNLGSGVQETVVVDAIQLDGVALRAELPALIVGSVLNGSTDPAQGYSEPLVIHTHSGGLSIATRGTIDGSYVFPDATAGNGTIQAFSGDGAIEGIEKAVFLTSGQIFGDQTSEDTLLSVSPPSGDADFDGLPDSFEQAFFNASVPTNQRGPEDDPDFDGLTNFDEFVAGTHPANFDSDSDGVGDGVELVLGANPLGAGSKPGPQDLVYVDFGFAHPLKAGVTLNPYATLDAAIDGLAVNGTIRIKGDVAVTTGDTPTGPLNKAMTIRAIGGTVRIE